MKQDLTGQTVVFTGAARGIGENVARLCAAQGARVGLIGPERDRLRDLADDLGPAATWREADIRGGAALRAAIDDCAEALGGIEFVVANAGVVAAAAARVSEQASD
jgi:NAD(P)-dependent dehydrogenase (short-subunit alcohol dehydrogenase family)